MPGYNAETQTNKNIMWMLPRPKPDHYKGGMPLYCEDWLIDLAKDILNLDNPRILNVFCGMNKHGIRVDLNEDVNPDFVGDVHKLSEFLPHREDFNIILADPPYSDGENIELYGEHIKPVKINYSKWTKECDKYLNPGGLFIIYHKFVPANPNPEKYDVVKRVGVINRIWHLPRVAIYFRKRLPP